MLFDTTKWKSVAMFLCQISTGAGTVTGTRSQAQAQVEDKDGVGKWRRTVCVIQGLEVFEDRVPPTKTKAKLRYDCFDPNCNFKNRDSSLDTNIKHLNDKHHVNARDIKMSVEERDRYLPVRTI